MPCLRHSSLVVMPASDSRKMATICSSVNLLRFMIDLLADYLPSVARCLSVFRSEFREHVITLVVFSKQNREHPANALCRDFDSQPGSVWPSLGGALSGSAAAPAAAAPAAVTSATDNSSQVRFVELLHCT